jgi:hypothetical protein
LQALALRARGINASNGGVLSLRMACNQRMVSFLNSIVGNKLYGPDGRTRRNATTLKPWRTSLAMPDAVIFRAQCRRLEEKIAKLKTQTKALRRVRTSGPWRIETPVYRRLLAFEPGTPG